MAKFGKMIAASVPPPGKLGKGGLAAADDDMDAPGDSSDADEDHAAELSAMEEFDKAEGPEDRLAALKNILAICKGY